MEKKVKIKQLYSYIAKRKKPWSVAVYDKKSKKRVVSDSLAAALKRFDKHLDSEDLIVIDYRKWQNECGDNDRVL